MKEQSIHPTCYEEKTVSVVGLGYIGLPTAAMFASRGIRVIGVDVNQQIVDAVNRGQILIVEPGLEQVVQAAVLSGHLRATCSPEPAAVFLVAVPTPLNAAHEPDTSYIAAAAQSIAPVLQKDNLVILESTSPVGTTEQLAAWLAQARPDLSFPQQQGEASDIRIAHCPERVLPGQILRELEENDRIIGGMTPFCARRAVELYQTFVAGECVVTDVRTAEMCKLTENAFRDVNIAFANELSMICDKLDVDVWELSRLANRHPRVQILQPGCGVGGHCIAVDPWFIVNSAPKLASLIRTAREVNIQKPSWILEKIKLLISDILFHSLHKSISDVQVACLGLAFKPDIDDLRESPAVSITQDIAQFGCRVLAVEPHIDTLPASLQLPNVSLASFAEASNKADVLCILIKHSMFVSAIQDIKRNKHVVDTVGLLSQNQ